MELRLAEKQLAEINVDSLQHSDLRIIPEGLEQAYVYPGPMPYSNQAMLADIYSDENLSYAGGIPLKLYIHLPFCKTNCGYCFYEKTIGTSNAEVDAYLKVLNKEMNFVLKNLAPKPKTSLIYLGGGTPNYLSGQQLDSLLKNILERVDFDEKGVLCVESHPSLLSPEHISVYSKHGVNRVSMGVQSTDAKVQHSCRRNQSLEDIIKAFDMARKCPTIKDINLDLIYGLPDQSFEGWLDTLQEISKLRPEEITVYRNRFHPNAPWFKQRKELNLPSLEDTFLMRLMSLNVFARELPNLLNVSYKLSRPHHHTLNLKTSYKRAPGMEIGNSGFGFQIGLGCSAYSHIGRYTYHNLQHIEEYMTAIGSKEFPYLRGKRLSAYERAIMHILGTLCSEGKMSKGTFKRTFYDLDPGIPKALRGKLLFLKKMGVVHENGDLLELTKAGTLYYEEIARLFYPPEMQKIYQEAIR